MSTKWEGRRCPRAVPATRPSTACSNGFIIFTRYCRGLSLAFFGFSSTSCTVQSFATGTSTYFANYLRHFQASMAPSAHLLVPPPW
jgi:hypothetical protein